MNTTKHKLKYTDITPKQKQIICNGCGSKGSIIPVPEFVFHASCNHHDFHYWRGCDGTMRDKVRDRLKADLQFYKALLQDCSEVESGYFWAHLYYWAVRYLPQGRWAYNWGNEKTIDDLPLINEENYEYKNI